MTGIFHGVRRTPGSGIATVLIVTDDGIDTVHVDAGPFFRAAERSGLKLDDTINYEVDDIGVMTSFQVED